MDFLTKLWHYITGTTQNSSTKKISNKKVSKGKSIMPKAQYKKPKPQEIQYITELSDEQILRKQNQEKHISKKINPDYKIKKGDNLDKIASKHNVTIRVIKELNGFNNKTVLKIGQKIKIPPTLILKDIHNLNNVAEVLGVNNDFIQKIKNLEDGDLPNRKFHNTAYKDKNGVLTIGIGHVVKKGDKLKLTNSEVCELFARDLLKAEDGIIDIISKNVYEKLPIPIKEALLDMAFNKGPSVIEKEDGLTFCLRTGKYEAAINKMTYNKSNKTKKEMSGLSKRRLFDISIALNVYKNNKIPKSNINTAQNVYNRGIQLLKAECSEKNINFRKMLAGYNKEVQNYFKGKLNLNYIDK